LELRKTHLYEYHKDHGNIVDFGGFAMPVWFEGVMAEHKAVRDTVGMFDTCHMGRSMAEGPDTEKFVNYVITNDVSRLEPKEGVYSVMCKPDGGIIDDLITYKISSEKFFIVYNASTREKDFAWLKKNSADFDVKLTDHSDEMAMIAVQGPKAVETVQKISKEDLSKVKRFNIEMVTLSGINAMVTRTGYTGEDGFELFIPNCTLTNPEKAVIVWNDLLKAGAIPCGLGSRDSLRLEAGLNLYGNDIDEETNPLEAKLRWVIKFKKPSDFIGRDALLKVRKEGVKKTQVGLQMVGRGIPRHGYDILDGGEVIGVVTSGGLAPSLGYGIAIGYVPPEYSALDTPVKIQIRKRLVDAKIVKSHPFYDDSVYGWKRNIK
jgi:aminomethyltransferase